MEGIKLLRERLGAGLVIPASPLAIDQQRRWDEQRQRALFRYYCAAGVGGLAIGVHTTQFAIHDPKASLYRPLLSMAASQMREIAPHLVLVAGICGDTRQAVAEASYARERGFHAGLLSLSALRDADEQSLIAHCRAVAETIPLFGFYLQPSVGGRILPFTFWRRFAEIENVVAIKIAPFNRYQTLDVVRAVVEAGREDLALYTGNDDSIVMDLLTPFRFEIGGKLVERHIVGGLLGHWAVWTQKAVELHAECRRLVLSGVPISQSWLARATNVTDANAAIFDAANGYSGCIPGLHEVLRRQGLFSGTWCLNPSERLSPGQATEIDRVYRAYPDLNDDAFVAENLESWLKG